MKIILKRKDENYESYYIKQWTWKNFTTKEKNAIIKEKTDSIFHTISSTLTPISDTIVEIKNKHNSEKNTPLNTENATILQQNSSSLPLNPLKTDPKLSASILNLDLSEKAKSAKLPYSIPKEKKERERLIDITGAYNLDKVNKDELQKHIKLEKKTPDDYYDINQPYNIIRKRIDEAFGPKTDFSISNFENNFDKMNKEEQSIITYKMQREFNKTGYTDLNGEKLNEDGIFGEKTKSAYNKYKNSNKKIQYYTTKGAKNDKENLKYYDMAVKDSNGNPIYLASTNWDLSDSLSPALYENTTTNTSNNLITIKEKEDSQLSFDDQKKIDALVYTYNNTDNIIEKEACIRAIVKIRQQKSIKIYIVIQIKTVYT